MFLQCLDDDRMDEFCRGECSDELASEIVEHLQKCSSCETKVQQRSQQDAVLIKQLRTSSAGLKFTKEPHLASILEKFRQRTLSQLNNSTSQDALSVEKENQSSNLPEIPKTFGRYKIKQVLGQGAMGAVYLVEDTTLHRQVALKVPMFSESENVSQEELLARFYREARSAATLRNPYICTVFDVGEIEGQHYISMAYIEGRSLKDALKEDTPFPQHQSADLVCKLASALKEAHENGVIHRDLKPSNIMLDRRDEPVIMDFGLARCRSNEEVLITHSGVIMGTPAYMSPEQVDGDQTQIGPQSDVYALGVIMYELLTGQLPFEGSIMSIFKQIALNDPTPPRQLQPEIDTELEKICLKMIDGEQRSRFQNAAEVADALREYLQKNQLKSSAGGEIERARGEHAKAKPTETDDQTHQKIVAKTDLGQHQRFPRVGMIIASVLGGLGILLGIVFIVRLGKYDVQIAVDDPAIKLSIDDGNALKIDDRGKVIRLSAGKHQLKLQKDDLETYIDEFIVTEDGKTRIRAVVLDNQLHMFLNGENSAKVEQTQQPRQTKFESSDLIPSSEQTGMTWPDDAPSLAIAPFDPVQAQSHQKAWAEYLNLPVEKTIALPQGVKLNFVLIPPGEFLMGSSENELTKFRNQAESYNDAWGLSHISREGPQHRVRISKPYYLGKYEVTRAQWTSITGTDPTNPSYQQGDPNVMPVVGINWQQCLEMLDQLNEQNLVARGQFLLPTEAQWEYACRSGTQTTFSFGTLQESIQDCFWYFENSNRKEHPVGELPPNSWGLHDMHGNVHEWVFDIGGAAYPASPLRIDPMGMKVRSTRKELRILRGGSVWDPPTACRSGMRGFRPTEYRFSALGTRLVLTIPIDN